MTTRDEMVRTLVKFCDEQTGCSYCLLKKFSDACYFNIKKFSDACYFNRWTDDKLAIAYDHVYKNGEARLDGSHLKDAELNIEPENNPDMVSHPKHYTQGDIECIDALKAATVGKRGIEAVCVANVIKYLWRYEEKNGIEDVRKAKWYIERLLKELEESQQS